MPVQTRATAETERLLILAVTGRAPQLLPGIYLGMSLIAFALYGLDKTAAQRGGRRTAETTLHLLGLAGGWPGALVAQRLFRHKTRKRPFQLIFRCTALINGGGLLWLLHALPELPPPPLTDPEPACMERPSPLSDRSPSKYAALHRHRLGPRSGA